MAVVGYYATLCQGCTLTSSAINIGAGIALVVFGVMAIMDKTTVPFGYMYLGYLMIAAGLWILINVVLCMVGVIQESRPSAKGGMIGTILCIFLLIGILGFAFMLKGKIEKGGRDGYLKLADEEKVKIEKKYECCGWDDVEKDHTAECKSKHPCEEPFGKALGKTAMMRMIIPAAAILVQAFVLFTIGCYYRKVTKKNPKNKHDRNLSLAEQAQMKREGKSVEPLRKSRLKQKQEKKDAKKEAKRAKKLANKS